MWDRRFCSTRAGQERNDLKKTNSRPARSALYGAGSWARDLEPQYINWMFFISVLNTGDGTQWRLSNHMWCINWQNYKMKFSAFEAITRSWKVEIAGDYWDKIAMWSCQGLFVIFHAVWINTGQGKLQRSRDILLTEVEWRFVLVFWLIW